jgi:ubiquinone/menaquinone biosynthesis C-methylase UbiE
MNQNYSQAYFDNRNAISFEIKAIFFALIIKILLRPKKLLDVGCAEGKLVKWAIILGIESWGVDISLAGLADQKWLRQRCRTGDILRLPFRDKEFSSVSCLTVMEHIGSMKTARALRELLRVSRRYVFLQICVKDNPFEGKHYLKDRTHVNVRESSWWINKFKDLKIRVKFRLPKFGWFVLEKSLL